MDARKAWTVTGVLGAIGVAGVSIGGALLAEPPAAASEPGVVVDDVGGPAARATPAPDPRASDPASVSAGSATTTASAQTPASPVTPATPTTPASAPSPVTPASPVSADSPGSGPSAPSAGSAA